MLDTCEDLPAGAGEKEAKLRAFLARFDGEAGGALAPPPAIEPACARDDVDRAYLLLLERAARVDRFFLALPAPERAAIVRLVRRMGEGMAWAVRTFAAQEGALSDAAQLSRYCASVLGNPIVFAEEMQRLQSGLDPELPGERHALAMRVGETIQLANGARDLEKDCARGVFYLPELRRARDGELPAAIASARRRLLARALEEGRAFRPHLAAIPSPRLSLARGAGLLMALFTLAFWQRTAARLGVALPLRDRVTKLRSAAWVARAISSRRGHDAVLARIDRIFAESAARLAEAGRTGKMGDVGITQGGARAAAGSLGPQLKHVLFRWRGWGVIALGIGTVVVAWPLRPQTGPALAALPVVLLGVSMRVWSRCYFTRGSDTRRLQAHRLVVLGPYRRVRNPLYVGNVAIAVGLALAFAGPWAAAAFLVALFAFYSGVIRSEEAVLARTWGAAYDDFRRRVPRWLPRIVPIAADPSAPAAELRHALRKERLRIGGAVGAWALAFALALLGTGAAT
jgi:protein-S-isoprenylcysteine O-methyltransferase Ste14/phytoene/squalene synthetase